MRAMSKCCAARASPFFDINPSTVPSKSESVIGRCRLKCIIISVNSANKAVEKNDSLMFMYVFETAKRKMEIPANKYMIPVTNTALICRWQTPKAPKSAALPKIIKHTNEQDIDKFCIPRIEKSSI